MTDDDLDRLAARSPRAAGAPGAAPTPRPRRSSLPWLLFSLLLAFTLGLLANPWFERQVRGMLPVGMSGEAETADAALAARVAALEAGGGDAARDARLARLEAQAAQFPTAVVVGGDAAAAREARTLFVLLGARRAVAYGRPLGAYDAALQGLFGARDPAALAALRALAARPVTRGTLRDALPAVATRPGLVAESMAGWRERLGGLIELRRQPASAQPAATAGATAVDPIVAAEAALAAWQLERAIAAAELAPRTPALAAWLGDARRLLAAEAALTRLEALALADGAAPPPPPPPPPAPQQPATPPAASLNRATV